MSDDIHDKCLDYLHKIVGKKTDFHEYIQVKVRSTGKLLDASIKLRENKKAEVNLIKPENGISPGQACVFYKKDIFGYKILGGGWIT